MKLVSVLKSGLKVTKKNGEEKVFKATEDVKKYVKSNIKPGDYLKVEFDDNWTIIKASGGNSNRAGAGNAGGGGDYNVPAERSVLQFVGNVVSGMTDVTTKNVKAAVKSLFELGMELVAVPVATDTAVEETNESEELEEEEYEEEEL